MIENLNGIHETVNYKNDMNTRLYLNVETEDYPPHWHIPFEIIMPVENGYLVQCEERKFSLREKDIIIICPGCVHEIWAPPAGKRMIFQFSLSVINSKELEVLTSIINPAILVTPEEYPVIHEQVCQLMMKIKDELKLTLPYHLPLVYSYFIQILTLVGRKQTEIIQNSFHAKNTNKPQEYMEKFLQVTSYINDHYLEDLTLDEIASLAGFSKYHFTRLFRQYAGTSFYKYLNQKRISHAKDLLMDPKLSVTEVALESGFDSISAFLRMFRLTNGCTPTEFRKMHQ